MLIKKNTNDHWVMPVETECFDFLETVEADKIGDFL